MQNFSPNAPHSKLGNMNLSNEHRLLAFRLQTFSPLAANSRLLVLRPLTTILTAFKKFKPPPHRHRTWVFLICPLFGVWSCLTFPPRYEGSPTKLPVCISSFILHIFGLMASPLIDGPVLSKMTSPVLLIRSPPSHFCLTFSQIQQILRRCPQ